MIKNYKVMDVKETVNKGYYEFDVAEEFNDGLYPPEAIYHTIYVNTTEKIVNGIREYIMPFGLKPECKFKFVGGTWTII